MTAWDGFQFGAYLAEPEGQPKGGLIVCQEIFGFNQYIESVCDFYSIKLARNRTLEFLAQHIG